MSKSISSQNLFSEYEQNLEHKAYYLLAGMADKIADSIRGQREAQSLSQCQLADLLGSKQSLVSRLENPAYGKYTLFTLAKVAAALNCELSVNMHPKKKATTTLVVEQANFHNTDLTKTAANNNVVAFRKPSLHPRAEIA
jgi:transcriptional regulator with XRE-family HTH domain